MSAFEDLRVVEMAGSAAGAYAAKLFADYGARVVRVAARGESSDLGDWSRWPASRIYLDTSKILVAPAAPERAATLERLLAAADVVIESSSPDPLEPQTERLGHAGLVRVYISPLGGRGPQADWRSNELTDEALGGHLYLNGEPDREPLARPGLTVVYQAGAHAFIGALAALYARRRIGRGQTVETSHVEGLAALHQNTTTMYRDAGHILRRDGNAQTGHWHPVGNYPCSDRWVHLSMPTSVMLEPFLRAAGLDALADDPRFCDDFARGSRKREFDSLLGAWLAEHSADEVIELGQRVRSPVGPVATTAEVLADAHLAARGFWVRLGDDAKLSLPRGPFLVENHPPRPRLPTFERGAVANAVAEFIAARPASTVPTGEAVGDGPLTGLRVLDLTRVWAGPAAARVLADLGADVTRIEAPWARGPATAPPGAGAASHLYPDDDPGDEPYNRELSFNKLNRNKRGITLDLATPDGLRLFEELAETSDVVIENYSPRVMGKLGLDRDRLRRLNPRLVHVAMPGFGCSGPKRDWLAFGPLIEASSGLSDRMGYRDSGPYRSGLAWPDPVSSLHAAAGTLMALLDRDHDGGARAPAVEVPMFEAMICFTGEELVDAQRGKAPEPRRGNRHPERAPQGVYPCAGNDRWLALSITSDEEWRALCELASLPAELDGLDGAARIRDQDAIDDLLVAWTRTREAVRLAAELQAHRIIAAPVRDARDLVDDAHLAARGFWVEVEHAAVGPRVQPSLPIQLSSTPATYRRGAPCLGQHNRDVLRQMLGCSEAQLDDLEDRGVLHRRPPAGATFRGVRAKTPAVAVPAAPSELGGGE